MGIRTAIITGTGRSVPDRILTNKDLEKIVDTSDEWIRTRTGIHERRIAAEGEGVSVYAGEAGRQAIEAAGVAPEEIDLVILATVTPDMPIPATALSFLVLGGLVAADRPMESKAGTGLAVALGLLHGQISGAEMAEAGLGLTGLLGTVGTLFVLVSMVAGLVASLRRPWTRIAVRVAGSWIVAMGLLYAGWALRGQG